MKADRYEDAQCFDGPERAVRKLKSKCSSHCKRGRAHFKSSLLRRCPAAQRTPRKESEGRERKSECGKPQRVFRVLADRRRGREWHKRLQVISLPMERGKIEGMRMLASILTIVRMAL